MRARPWIGVLAAAVFFPACGGPDPKPASGADNHSTPAAQSRFHDDAQLRIGAHTDQPKLSFYDTKHNVWSGFDIDVANYVMAQLKVPTTPDNPHIYPVLTGDRTNHLLQNIDDLIIASYSITDERIKKGITFTAPYLLSYQDILIRASDTNKIKNVDDLRGKRVCTGPKSSTPYQHLVSLNQSRSLNMILDPQPGQQICIDKLITHETDADVTDSTVLLGFLSRFPQLHLVGTKVWPRPEQYGIGLIAKTPADVSELNAIIRQMTNDGSWRKAVITNFCPSSHSTDKPCRIAQIFLDNPPSTS